MRGFTQLFVLFLILAGATASAAPQAHWISEKQIQVFFPWSRTRTPLQFQIVTDDPAMTRSLPLLERHGDIWALSSEPLRQDLKNWIKRPVWVRALSGNSTEVFRTSIRLTGLLDQKFANAEITVGLKWETQRPKFCLWAPTAQKVELLRFESARGPLIEKHLLSEDPQGFWTVTGLPDWSLNYYLYRVTVFSPESEQVEVHEVTDPASIALAMEGARSQILNPEDPRTMPPGWKLLEKPVLENLTDSVIYEMHIRDYTAADPDLSPAEKGTYLGLVSAKSRSFAHLKELAKAGLTHIHLLPVLDFAGVPENKASLRILQPSLIYAPDSPVPQELVGRVRNQDAYNWGYNPVHWMVPEGSYAQNPDGENRMREFRTMIQRYNQAGLRVILDVVFNHTYASGIEDFSIFDRVVPFYYHRYNERGELMKSSCCADIATENKMVEKLILDSLVFLATAYKVDGFRFDLLNLHPKMQIPKIREALLDLTPAKAGVDGTKILLYAEAWPFGSLEDLFPGSSFNQLRSYGLGMGAFNDRFRDALRGGTTDAREKSDPGFATGLYWDFNHDPSNTNSPMDPAGQKEKILSLADVMKVGLAGNLRDFIFRDHRNNLIRGGELNFRGAPVGYAAEPNETITYVSAHDGSTLWDAIQAKLPFSAAPRNPPIANLDERVRTMKLLLGTIAVSQGIPFFEGATELLRSKSGDVDSYDSGDWFNQIDWTFQSNNWGVGLPPLWRNQGEWGFWQPRLINPILRVDRDHILSTREHFKALLSLRKSMPLLRLSTAADIKQSVSFPVDEQTGADLPGLIAMFIQDVGKKDRLRKSVLVLINSAPIAQEIRNSSFKNRAWQFPDSFGPQQDRVLAEAEWNENQGLVKVPGRTVLVLEERQ